MASADTTRSQLAFRRETAFDEAVPGTPTLQVLRVTKYSMKHANGTVISDELRADRGRSDLLKTGESATGSFSFELSADTFDDFLEASVGAAFSGGVLKNGTSLLRSFQFEDQALDIAQFIYLKGMELNDFNLGVDAGGIVTGDATFMGNVGDIFGTTRATTTTAKTTTPIMAAGLGVSNILLNGTAIGVDVKGLKFSIKNNLRARPVVDSLRSRQRGRGDLDIGVNISAYFASSALWSLFRANSALALQVTFADGTTTGSKAYDVLFPKLKIPDDTVDVSGINADRMEELTLRALHDNTTNCQISITKRTIP